MKKLLSLCLAFCLLLGATNALAAAVVTVTSSDATTMAADSGESTAVMSMASLNGAAYLLYGDGRLTRLLPATREETLLGRGLYTAGYADAKALADALTGDKAGLCPLELLYVQDGALMGVNLADGAVYALLDASGAYAPAATGTTLDAAALKTEGGENRLTLLSAFAQDNALYCLTRDDASGKLTTALVALPLGGGAAKGFTVQNVQDIQPYQGGLLLARRFDISALLSATGQGGIPASDYGTFDPATDTFAALGTFTTDNPLNGYSISGMVYAAAADSLYYISGSRIQGLAPGGAEPRVSAYTSEGMFGSIGAVSLTLYVDGGYYLRGDYSGWKLYALDTDAAAKGALRIFGEFGSEAHKSFAINYPDIPVEVASEFTADLTALANAMVSDSGAYDVLLLMMSYMPVERLLQKGYCTDLSAYPEIMERVAGLDPRFVSGMTVDGKLYGVPVASTGYSYGVNMEQWQALGLTEADLPTNLVDFYGFVANYLSDYGEDEPGLRLFDMEGEQLKTILFSLMLDNYITYCQAQPGGATVFDGELPRTLLTAFEQIDFDALKQNVDTTNADYQQRPYLFSAYMPLTAFSSAYDGIEPLILSLTADTQPVVGANLSVLVINPRTQRMDDAVKYVCNYLDNLDDSAAIVLHPDDNQPRVAKGYEKNLQALNDEITKQQALLDAAEDSQKAALRDKLDQLNAQLADLTAHQYSVTAAQIERFRAKVSPLLAVCQQSVLYSADQDAQKELSKLILQYLGGAVTKEQFLKEMDQRSRMMVLEDQ